MQKVILAGIYDANTVSLAPQVLRSYAEKHSEVAAQFEIVTKELSIFRDSVRHIADEINKERADIVLYGGHTLQLSTKGPYQAISQKTGQDLS